MGIDINTKAGVYMELEGMDMKRTVKGEIQTCSNVDCRYHGRESADKFCPECGSEIRKIEWKHEEDVNMLDVLDELGVEDDFLSAEEVEKNGERVVVYLCNGVGKTYDNKYETFVKEITPEMIKEEMETVEKSPDMIKLSEYFKSNGIGYSLKYGIVGYMW